MCFCSGKASITSVGFSFIDQKQLDDEIKALHKELKAKVNRLNEIQGTFSQQRHFVQLRDMLSARGTIFWIDSHLRDCDRVLHKQKWKRQSPFQQEESLSRTRLLWGEPPVGKRGSEGVSRTVQHVVK